MKYAPEGAFFCRVFVNVWNAKFRLPEKSLVGTLQNLVPLGDRMHRGFERRTAIGDSECSRVDLGNNLLNTPTNGSKILDALVPQKPALIGSIGIVAPTLDQLLNVLRPVRNI